MGVIKNIFKARQKRSAEITSPAPSVTEVESQIASLLAGKDPSTIITPDTALSISAVWACVTILSDTIAALPLHLFQRTSKGSEKVDDGAAINIIKHPNSYASTFDLLNHLMIGVTLWGNGYCRIIRDKYFQPIKLKFLQPYEVFPLLTLDDDLVYSVSGEFVMPHDIIHLKGLVTNKIEGKSPIAVHRENLSLCKSALTYGEKFFSEGGNTEGAYTYPTALKDDAFKRLKAQLMEHATLKEAHHPLLLEGGMKYERINIPLEDAQFIATRKFQATEIARIFRVPPHMIQDLDRSTNNNIEHQGIEFVQYSLMPYVKKIETELNTKILSTEESKSQYFNFNLNSLMRGDSAARANFYKNMNLIGAMSANEIRELENFNRYDGGDNYMVQSNMQTITKAINDNTNGKGTDK